MVAGVAGSKREKGSGVCRHVEANEDRWGWNEVIQLLSHVVVDLETFFPRMTYCRWRLWVGSSSNKKVSGLTPTAVFGCPTGSLFLT
jgi:hypothetical protein